GAAQAPAGAAQAPAGAAQAPAGAAQASAGTVQAVRAPPPEKNPPRAKPAVPVAPNPGELVLGTRLPNRTSVSIDGQKAIVLGTKPTSVTVPAGTRRLRIERDGAASCTATIRVQPEGRHPLLVEAGAVVELAGTTRTPIPCK
ncbi:MAG TPA: hypothetical protein VGD74_10710, partial [Vulgatibacter sp.]